MQMNILVTLILLAFGYLGFTRGFYSMVIHLACVIIAGAVAFGVWETVAYYILTNYFDSQWIVDNAWGAALGLPFALTLAVLIGITAALLRGNVKVPVIMDNAGGGVVGIASGFLVAGMAVLSVSFCRGHSDLTGYTPVVQQSNGSLVRSDGLWIPVDRLTAKAFQFMSQNSLYEEENLEKYYPDLASRAHLMGLNPDNATLKLALPPKSVDYFGRYTVGLQQQIKYEELVSSTVDTRKQALMDLDGDDYKSQNNAQYYLEGHVISMKSSAREQIGQVAMSAGSVTLVMYDTATEESLAIQPFAMISQARPDPAKPLNVVMARWRFDAKGTVLGSVGGATDSVPMAFEFLAPKRPTLVPLALYVRGTRIDLLAPDGNPKPAKKNFATIAERDTAIPTADIIEIATGGALNPDGAQEIKIDKNNVSTAVVATSQLPFNIVLNKGDINFPVDEKNRLMDGKGKFNLQQLNNRGIERDLRVDRFLTTSETAMVQIDVSKDSPLSMLSNAASEGTGAPVLVASNGQRFTCIGWVYKDASLADIRHTPSSPVDNKDSIPSITMSRSDQQIRLLFSVTVGAEITQYAIGDKVVGTFPKPMKVEAQR